MTNLLPDSGMTASISSDHTYSMSSSTLTAGLTTCSTCGIWVSRVRQEQHMERQHRHKYNRRQFQCRQCGKLSRCQEALLMHFSKYHQDLCSVQKGLTTENMKNCSNSHKIKIAEESTTTDQFTPPHFQDEEEMNVMNMVKCKQCGILLDNDSNLAWHFIRVHSQASVFCPKCKCYCPPNHLKKNHTELREQNVIVHKCRLCDK